MRCKMVGATMMYLQAIWKNVSFNKQNTQNLSARFGIYHMQILQEWIFFLSYKEMTFDLCYQSVDTLVTLLSVWWREHNHWPVGLVYII